VLDNQALLIAGFKYEAASTDLPIVFDGHSVIDGRDGLIEIPTEVFSALGLDAICFLQAEPSDIFVRRQSDMARPRPARTVEALGEHQKRAIALAMRIADRLDCPFSLITNEDSAKLIAFIAGQTR
jgi:adenylate kinase